MFGSRERPHLQRIIAWLVLAVALTVDQIAATQTALAAQARGCTFTLGFQVLHDQTPAVVGECLEDEHFNLENGNAEQRTTRGLLVWRKADNWTAFTDGTTTWIIGPQGLASRPNAGPLFPWEAAAPAPAPQASAPLPSTPSPPVGAPAPPVTPPAPAASGPIQKSPAEILLGLGDVGKEIVQVTTETGSDRGARWAEIRFQRGREFFKSNLGPLKIYNKAYVADDLDAARTIYRREVGQQRKLPEAQDRVEGFFVPEGVVGVGDEQDVISACNYDCGTSGKFDSLHQRAVVRLQNVVLVLYFFGRDVDADVDQLNEWLPKLRDRAQ